MHGYVYSVLPLLIAEPVRKRLQPQEVSVEAGGLPNFLFIYTDDERYDCLGAVQEEQGERARFPWLKTPNLDRLAKEGVRFRNAFVVQSLCTPSRASFLTGTYTQKALTCGI